MHSFAWGSKKLELVNELQEGLSVQHLSKQKPARAASLSNNVNQSDTQSYPSFFYSYLGNCWHIFGFSNTLSPYHNNLIQ